MSAAPASVGAVSRPVTRRLVRPLTPRRAYWCPVAPSARALLDRLDALDGLPGRVFMVGARPGGVAGAGAFAFGEPLPARWSHNAHYLDSDAPVLRFTRDDGAAVDVLRAAAWFGDGDYPVRVARDAFALVRELVEREFPGAAMLTTPATTGRELVARSLPHDYREPTLSDDDQNLIRATSGQGRTTHDAELARRAAAHPTIDHLAVLDCRFAYAALCWELPAGAATRCLGIAADDVNVMARARWRVRATVPRDWSERCACGAPGHPGIGLLGVRGDDGAWRYPSAPGRSFETWCDGAELHVARAHGWRADVLDGLAFATSKARPLDTWAEHLRRARAAAELRHEVEPDVRALARGALRMIVLATIGALLGAPRDVTRALPRALAHQLPAHVAPKRAGDLLVWSETAGSAWPAMSRPEWSACIYGRCRARLLDAPTGASGVRAGALHVPAATVLAMRTDALYLAAPAPAWPDDGRAGRFTVRADRPGPHPTPRSTDELRALVGGDA